MRVLAAWAAVPYARPSRAPRLPIRLTPVRDSHDNHDEPLVLDDIQDAVVADAGSPYIFGSAKLCRSGAGVRGKAVDATADPPPHGRIKLRQGSRGGGQELDGVHGEGLQLQPSFELLPADSLSVRRITQRRAHLVKVARILDGLEELQVLDRNHGGNALSVPGQDDPLASECHSIDRRRERLSRLADPSLSHGRIVQSAD